MFFDIYFDRLLRISERLGDKDAFKLHDLSLDEWTLFERLQDLKVTVNLKIGFKTTYTLECTYFNLYSSMLNLIKVFPKIDQFDKLNSASFINVSYKFGAFLKNIAESKIFQVYSGLNKPSNKENYFKRCSLKFCDLFFLIQGPMQLMIEKRYFKYSTLSLLSTLTLISRDKYQVCMQSSIEMSSIMQTQTKYVVEYDTHTIENFIKPLTELYFDCYGAMIYQTFNYANSSYCKHLQTTNLQISSNTYSFLNLFKFNFFPQLADEVNLVYLADQRLGRNPSWR